QVGRIKLHQQIAFVYELIALDIYLRDVRRNLWAYLNYVAIDESIVGRFELSCIEPIYEPCKGGNQQNGTADNKDPASLAVRLRLGSFVFFFDLACGFVFFRLVSSAFFGHQFRWIASLVSNH